MSLRDYTQYLPLSQTLVTTIMGDTSAIEEKKNIKPSPDSKYADSVEMNSKTYHQFANEGFGQSLRDFYQQYKGQQDAVDLSDSAKKLLEIQALQTSLDAWSSYFDDNSTDLRVLRKAISRFHSQENSIPNFMENALRELKTNIPDRYKCQEIDEKDSDGVATGKKIQMDKILRDVILFEKYLNDPQIKAALRASYNYITDSDRFTKIPELKKTIEEESQRSKSLAKPIAGTLIGIGAASGTVNGISKLYDYCKGYDKLVSDAGQTVFRQENSFPQLLTKVNPASVTEESLRHCKARIEHNLSRNGLSKNTLNRLTQKALTQAVSQTSAQATGWLPWLGKGLGKVGGFFGIGGGPWGLALTIAAPFLIDWAIADAQDAFRVASGRSSENKGSGQIGEWLGGIGRGYYQYFFS